MSARFPATGASRQVSDIHVVEAGAGPLLLCLHGIGSSSASFAPQLEELAGEMRVLAWDAPGYGKSAHPDRAPGLDGYAAAAASLIRDHGGSAHVLGVSWGGVIAMRLALAHPGLVRSLILADSSCGSGRSAEQASAMRQRAAELEASGPEAFARERAPRLVSSAADPDLVERVVTMMSEAIRLPGYAHAAEAMAQTDLEPELTGISTPTLVLCGDRDEVTGLPESQILAAGIPNAVLVTIAGAGHLSNQEQPGSFNAWVKSYVQIIERLLA